MAPRELWSALSTHQHNDNDVIVRLADDTARTPVTIFRAVKTVVEGGHVVIIAEAIELIERPIEILSE
jgi:hypothetical protein